MVSEDGESRPGGVCLVRKIVAISDACVPPVHIPAPPLDDRRFWQDRLEAEASAPPTEPDVAVRGGYLERLPLAAVRAGLCGRAEIWSFTGSEEGRDPGTREAGGLVRRRFRADGPAPFASADLLAHLDAYGPPDILCVWGLGVDEAVLARCATSVKVYNSIDAPALRMPPEVTRHIDIFLASAPWQAEEIARRHPGALTAVMPIGPEFASPETFFPTGAAKDFDVVYVAAAQPYKRHDILFDAFARLPPHIRGLCVFGYGELGEAYRNEIAARGLGIECVGPPGLPYPQVNDLMNRARIGVVCGEADGAPAILTEYMLAGLPVLANAALCCGLQFIRPETGAAVPAGRFAEGIIDLLARAPTMAPRQTVLDNWTWEKTIERFSELVDRVRHDKFRAA